MEDIVLTEHFEATTLGPQKFGIVLLLFSWSLLPVGFAMMIFLFQDFIELQNYFVMAGLTIQVVALFFAVEKTPNRLLLLTSQWRFALFFVSISLAFTIFFQSIWPSTSGDIASFWWLPLTLGTASVFTTYAALNTASSSSRIVYELPCSYKSNFDFSGELAWKVESAVFRHGILAYVKLDWESVLAVVGKSSQHDPPSAFIRCVLLSTSSVEQIQETIGLIKFSGSMIGPSSKMSDEES